MEWLLGTKLGHFVIALVACAVLCTALDRQGPKRPLSSRFAGVLFGA